MEHPETEHPETERPETERPEDVGVVVSRADGAVVAQSAAARALLGPSAGRTCWSLMLRTPAARRLPCQDDCVARRLADGRRSDKACAISLRGRRFELSCVPVDDHVVTILRPEPGPLPEPWEHLTPREISVLRLMADGLSTDQIAASLDIKPGTVRTHVEHMRGRLGCATRAALVAKGFRLKYLG